MQQPGSTILWSQKEFYIGKFYVLKNLGTDLVLNAESKPSNISYKT